MKKIFTLAAAAIMAATSVANAESTDFTLLTDASKLADGCEIVLVAMKGADYYAMSTTQNANNRGTTIVTVEGDVVTPNEETQIVTLVDGGPEQATQTWLFKVGEDAYLYAAGGTGTKNYMRTGAISEVSYATIAIDATTGESEIVFQGNVNRNTLQFNANNAPTLFSCYNGAQTPPYIYMRPKQVPTGVNDVNTAKAVKSVRYFNLMGVESADLNEGVNIVVTTYTDGTTASAKVIR
ncbi:MAG: hypothetical protein Q4B68_10645 [Bacteroidales bacterium]|nr:hypothetical protein [Bacteroidales bacterium]